MLPYHIGSAIFNDTDVQMDSFCPGCFGLYLNTYAYEREDFDSVLNYNHLTSDSLHCKGDSFTLDDKGFAKIVQSPPVPLQEKYFQCTKTFNQVIVDSFGIANSNAVSFGSALIGVIVYVVLWSSSKYKFVLYEKELERSLKEEAFDLRTAELQRQSAENDAHENLEMTTI